MLPPPPAQHSVALVGFMGVGKSTVGQRVATRLGLPFVDLDAHLAETVGAPAELIARRGEAAFRALEAEAVREVAARGPCVLATGGGTITDPRAHAELVSRFRTVHLDAPLDVCEWRVGAGEGRPLWPHRRELFEARAPLYALSAERIDATGPPDAVAAAVCAALSANQDDTAGYPIRAARSFGGLAASLDAHAPGPRIVITDDRVAGLHLDALRAELGDVPALTFPHGEPNKTLQTYAALLDGALQHARGRATVIVAVGGGVVGDMAGFVAATALRGLRVAHVATTTLAMADSSVGGKTAVNHPRGKNLVGSFHPPSAVWLALHTLATLDRRHVRAGLAEVVKIAATHDAHLFELIEALGRRLAESPLALEHALRAAIRRKAQVVTRDPLESGERIALNAGHTVAHALEHALGYGTLLHGEAVAIGLVAETAWTETRGLTAPGTADRLRGALEALDLPIEPPSWPSPAALAAAMRLDKKVHRDTIPVPYVSRLGRWARLDVDLTQLSMTQDAE